MHGKGKFKWPDGKQYMGCYVNDKMEGFGVLTYEDGRIYSG